jgi:hypothetical protein
MPNGASKVNKTEPVAPFAPASAAIAAGLGRTAEISAQVSLKWQREMTDFMLARMQADLELQRSAAECKNIFDLIRLQQRWTQAAARSYLEESRRLGEIAKDATQDGLEIWVRAIGADTEMPSSAN